MSGNLCRVQAGYWYNKCGWGAAGAGLSGAGGPRRADTRGLGGGVLGPVGSIEWWKVHGRSKVGQKGWLEVAVGRRLYVPCKAREQRYSIFNHRDQGHGISLKAHLRTTNHLI